MKPCRLLAVVLFAIVAVMSVSGDPASTKISHAFSVSPDASTAAACAQNPGASPSDSTAEQPNSAPDEEPSQRRPRTTVLGTRFAVYPQFDRVLEDKIVSLRNQIRAERGKGKFIAYISVPLTGRGGGHQETNNDISRFTKLQLEAMYGSDRLWALSPGQVESTIPSVDGLNAGGGEYMYMWTQVLAGEDGLGRDFDMVYFVGPKDMLAFFNLGRGAILESLDRYVDDRAATDESFRGEIAENPKNRQAFLRYYGLRASASFSSGALDEWNIFRIINARRSIGDQIPAYFNHRAISPGEMSTVARPGYELVP